MFLLNGLFCLLEAFLCLVMWIMECIFFYGGAPWIQLIFGQKQLSFRGGQPGM